MIPLLLPGFRSITFTAEPRFTTITFSFGGTTVWPKLFNMYALGTRDVQGISGVNAKHENQKVGTTLLKRFNTKY